MGTFEVQLTVVNPLDPARQETLTCLVDSGATYSVIPRPVLERLGVQALGEYPFTVATGESVRWQVGGVEVRYNGRRGWTMAVFGSTQSPAVLGAHGLEALSLGIDPLNRRLIPITPLAV